MSRIAEIVLIVGREDDANVEALSYWMETPDAFSPSVTLFREVDAVLKGESERLETTAPLGRVGSLRRLNGSAGLELWGGDKAPSVSVWGSVTNNMDWSRFIDEVARTPWEEPERVQLLLKDESDPFFRVYMFEGDQLRNVIPEPDDEDIERPW